jgi:outer membrane protein assembly factor BamB
MHVETGFDGTVSLQASRDGGENWIDTGYTAAVAVATPMGMDVPSASPEVTADPEGDDYYDVDAERSGTDGGEGTGTTPAPVTPAQDDAMPEAKPTEKPTEDEAEDEWDKGEPGVLYTPAPTATPTPAEAAVTATPPLAADPAPEANPDLINQTVVWTSFVKKEKDYNRLAKEQVHMPAGDEYTTKKLGVMTFRGDNFRRNAAAGTLGGTPQKMAVLWQAEAGSIRGTNTTFYGYGWTNQPVIARWSTEVRTKSNITEAKIDKSALKEVIIAGLDGAIRFLDLEDGKITRNSIKLGYPMRGTPSLHPRGYPFLTVGQFARKTKARTGKIGLRQYNLYTQKELKLIDGLDGKYHRPLNDIGSFETSALIDRESDTLIVAGTNGMLYLESLGTNFDYSLGVLQISPSIVAMSSRAKGQKSNALLAVESSPAAYDKYVYYADMGGVLRCVDTNTLRPVWAVNTGDSVMAAVALDLTPERELNLYTANMLNNRKKGNGSVQIRKYDALSGREAWCTDVGVLKSKKDKEKDNVGAKASPVIGQNGLSDLVYFTVTGLSGEGAETLGLNGETPAALIALSKDNGRVVWAFALGSRSESSPVALYDKQGNGWIIQCEQSGMVHLLDGRTGREINNLQLEGEVEASPAAYNNVVVVGTTGKGKAFVYGIEVKLDKTEETEAPAGNEEGREGETVGDEESAGEEPADDEAGMENEDGGADRHDEYEDYEDYEDYDAEDEESGDGRQ